jgi:hypothetical protein
MTFKEFREMAHGVYDWQLYVIDEGEITQHYGYEETLDDKYDDLKVISFNITARSEYHITCQVDLI